MLDIIFFATIAAFLAYRLYNTLGRKDFEHGKVVTCPKGKMGKIIKTSYVEVKPEDDNEKLEEKFGKKLAEGIKAVRKYDPAFAVEVFLAGARKAFEIIVKSFSAGDRDAMQPLLSAKVYQHFMEEMDKREKGESFMETTLVAISSMTIKDISVNSKKYVRIAIQIASEQINVLRDRQRNIIDGNPSQVDKIEELWVFGRDLASQNPNWELLETSAA